MYLCYWYKPSERATRLAIFAGSVAVAGAFSGLLASGISFLNGKANLAGWQWLFILTGIPAVLFGIIVWILMPNYPQDAKFLTAEERAFACARMGPFAPNKEDKTFDGKVAKKTMLDPVFWLYAVSYFFMVNSLNAFSYFSPTIIANLGFEGYVAQLLTVPPNSKLRKPDIDESVANSNLVFGLIIIVTNCFHSDYSKERIGHSLAGLTLVGTGYLLLALLTNWIGRYVAVFLIACTNAAVMPFLAHRTATVSGSTATALATGVTIAFSNCGGISAPFIFPSSDGPNYLTGNVSLPMVQEITDEILTLSPPVDHLRFAVCYFPDDCWPGIQARHQLRVPRLCSWSGGATGTGHQCRGQDPRRRERLTGVPCRGRQRCGSVGEEIDRTIIALRETILMSISIRSTLLAWPSLNAQLSSAILAFSPCQCPMKNHVLGSAMGLLKQSGAVCPCVPCRRQLIVMQSLNR